MTDGPTEGRDEPATDPECRPAAHQEGETRVLKITPAVDESRVRPRVVLLGADEFSRELAIALRHFGAEVIAVDGRADAPGHGVADQALVVTMTDAGEVAALIRRLQPDFVATATDAVSLDALAALEGLAAEEKGSMELVPSARSLRLAAEREGLRRLAADELGLPTAPFWFVGSLGELQAVAAHAGFPLLVKPAVGAGGQGHSVVTRPDEVEHAWRHAVGPETGAGDKRVLAERLVEIQFHVTLLVVRSEGPQGSAVDFCTPIGHRHAEADDLESWQPQKLSPSALDAAKSIAARIVKALGGRGVFSVNLMINGDEVYFVDVTACPRHSAWVTLRSQRLSAFELQARAILGLALDTMMISPAAARVVEADPAAGDGSAADALTAALSVPESDVRVFGRGRGVALATAPDVAAARDRAREVANALRRQP